MKGFGVLLVCVLLAIAAGIAAVAGAGSTPAKASAPGATLSPGVLDITRVDGGRTIHVRLHQTVDVILGDTGLVWSALREVGPQLLRPEGRLSQGTTEDESVYEAVALGRTTLEATAAPKCSPDEACPQFLLLWRVQVSVT